MFGVKIRGLGAGGWLDSPAIPNTDLWMQNYTRDLYQEVFRRYDGRERFARTSRGWNIKKKVALEAGP